MYAGYDIPVGMENKKVRLSVPVDLDLSQPVIRIKTDHNYDIGAVKNFLRKPDEPSVRAIAKWGDEKGFDIFVGGSVVYNFFTGNSKKSYEDIDLTFVSEDVGKINLVMEYFDCLNKAGQPLVNQYHTSWFSGKNKDDKWKDARYTVSMPSQVLSPDEDDENRMILIPHYEDFKIRANYTPQMAPIDINFIMRDDFRDQSVSNLQRILKTE